MTSSISSSAERLAAFGPVHVQLGINAQRAIRYHFQLVGAALWDYIAPQRYGRGTDAKRIGNRALASKMIDGRLFEHGLHFSMLKCDVNNAQVQTREYLDMTYPIATVGDRIREQRKAKGLDQAPVAKAARITVSALSQIENNVTRSPKPETLFMLADVLGVEPRYLVFGHLNRVAPAITPLSFSDAARVRLTRK